MSRRGQTKFERMPRDLYRTFDPRAVKPLLRFLEPGTLFVEPCAGHGDLVDHLVRAGHICHAAIDIHPMRGDIKRGDAMDLRWRTKRGIWCTNPPWRRDILHPLIRHLSLQAPCWLLFDSGWAFNAQSSPFMPLLRKIVAVGRVQWIPGSESSSLEDSAWFLFDGTKPPGAIEFHGREA